MCSFPFLVQNCSSRTMEQPSNPLASFEDAGLTRAHDYTQNRVTDRTVPILSPELEACRPLPRKNQEPNRRNCYERPTATVRDSFRPHSIIEQRSEKERNLLQFLFWTELIGMTTFFFTTINRFGRKPGVTFATNFFITIVFLG